MEYPVDYVDKSRIEVRYCIASMPLNLARSHADGRNGKYDQFNRHLGMAVSLAALLISSNGSSSSGHGPTTSSSPLRSKTGVLHQYS